MKLLRKFRKKNTLLLLIYIFQVLFNPLTPRAFCQNAVLGHSGDIQAGYGHTNMYGLSICHILLITMCNFSHLIFLGREPKKFASPILLPFMFFFILIIVIYLTCIFFVANINKIKNNKYNVFPCRDRPKLVFFDLTECISTLTQVSTQLFGASCPTKQVIMIICSKNW